MAVYKQREAHMAGFASRTLLALAFVLASLAEPLGWFRPDAEGPSPAKSRSNGSATSSIVSLLTHAKRARDRLRMAGLLFVPTLKKVCEY
jgi:hypothetical protein